MQKSSTYALVFGLTLALFLSSASGALAGRGNGPGGSGAGGDAVIAYVRDMPAQDLDQAEAETLVFMYEEEKLARDVYTALDDIWNLPVFDNIARSEQQHMDTLAALLEKYGLALPSGAATVYEDARLAELYAALTEQGAASLAAGLTVGATIEDLDIADLRAAIAATDNADLQVAYQNLMMGSRNHLRSFGGQLAAQDAAYAAQYLDQAEVDAIIASEHERGMVDQNGEHF